jgi:hypothetical protein
MSVDGRGRHIDAFTNQFIGIFNFTNHNIELLLIPYYKGLSEKINFTLLGAGLRPCMKSKSRVY